jgi:hypothetical protein
MRSRFTLLLGFVVAAALAVAIACGGSAVQSPAAATSANAGSTTTPGSGPAPGPAPAAGTGTLSISIKDSPFSDAKALLVTFSEVSVHTSDGAWVKLPFEDGGTTRTCDLKRLVSAEDVLGVGTLAAGHYTQLRLAVSSAKLYFTATTSTTGPVCDVELTLDPLTDLGVAIDVPSDTLKLNREFDVPSAGATKILLDFDGDKSIHQTGNGKYKMTPVIGVVSVQ